MNAQGDIVRSNLHSLETQTNAAQEAGHRHFPSGRAGHTDFRSGILTWEAFIQSQFCQSQLNFPTTSRIESTLGTNSSHDGKNLIHHQKSLPFSCQSAFPINLHTTILWLKKINNFDVWIAENDMFTAKLLKIWNQHFQKFEEKLFLIEKNKLLPSVQFLGRSKTPNQIKQP